MKAIKIDVVNKDVYYVDIQKGGLQDKYDQVDCDIIALLCIRHNGDFIFIDDEGLFRDPPLGAFITGDYGAQPISGHALVVGDDGEGGDADVRSTLEEIRNSVAFVDAALLKGVPTAPVVIPLTDQEFKDYLSTGQLPLGKQPQNPQ